MFLGDQECRRRNRRGIVKIKPDEAGFDAFVSQPSHRRLATIIIACPQIRQHAPAHQLSDDLESDALVGAGHQRDALPVLSHCSSCITPTQLEVPYRLAWSTVGRLFRAWAFDSAPSMPKRLSETNQRNSDRICVRPPPDRSDHLFLRPAPSSSWSIRRSPGTASHLLAGHALDHSPACDIHESAHASGSWTREGLPHGLHPTRTSRPSSSLSRTSTTSSQLSSHGPSALPARRRKSPATG